jgi:thioredoxin-related protein
VKRTCSYCNKEKPLNKKHFQVVKMFKKGFSFMCLDCDEKSKKPKPRDKGETKFLKEKVEVKLAHKDIAEIVGILGYYKGELQSSEEYDIPTHRLDKLIKKLQHQLEEHK